MDEETRLRTLYVGGLSEEVTEDVLRSVFIAFGDVKEVQIPVDHGSSACDARTPLRQSGATRSALRTAHVPTSPHACPRADTHRGFGFVTMDERDDARDAIDNLHNCELYGRVLTVNTSKKMTGRLGGKSAVWEGAGAKEWFDSRGGAEGAAGGAATTTIATAAAAAP